MNDSAAINLPSVYEGLKKDTLESNFPMASEILTCSLLRTLAASKPGSKFLELGTGTGLSTSWILEGMDDASGLISIDNDPVVQVIAQRNLRDERLTLICADGIEWLSNNAESKFDFIFADAWPGKYQMLDETLAMLNPGGLYIIDDMLPQENWPAGHDQNVEDLLTMLSNRDDLKITRQSWASGMVICVKCN